MHTERPLRLTLVTSAHIANNPRLVKEADALTAAGHAVRVVAPLQHAHLAARDDRLMASRAWRLRRVNVSRNDARGRLRWMAGVAMERGARLLFARGVHGRWIADQALYRHLSPMVAATVEEPADVVVGHNEQALPVAARAARALGARLAFDIEDLHTGEQPDDQADVVYRQIVATAERRYLPQCELLSASSAGIADEIVRLYGVRRPRVVLNVFPLAERALAADVTEERPAGARVSLYWYSQVVGARRGIEDAIGALARLPRDVHLTLRGDLDTTFAQRLAAEVDRMGIRDRVHVRGSVAPDELVPRAGRHDIGLALEQPLTRNRQLCVTNKIFTYLLAGLAVAATDTEGQRRIMREVPAVGFVYTPGDVDALARGLQGLLAPDALAAAKHAARAAAHDRYNWELEQANLVEHLTGRRAAVAEPQGPACATS